MAIECDDLIYTNAHVFFHDGVPFTGLTEDLFPDGTVQCRIPFLDGREHGVAEEFFSSGARKECIPYSHGSVHGRHMEWYEDGSVKLERDVEFGFMIRCREFDEAGHLTKEYVRPEDDAIMEYVKARRAGEST